MLCDVLKKVINQSTSLIPKNMKNFFKPMNAKAPILTGLPKIHKTNTSIRPLVNYTTAPAYKISKFLEKIIKNNIKI